MKYLKLFMLFAVAAVFTACSDNDDENWNSNSATVTMAQGAMTVSEAKGLFNVPVAVSGERNANVQVTVAVAAADVNPATEDVDYLITTKTINISPDQTVGNIQIKSVDNEDINENRKFTLTIVDVKGATLGDVKSTEVTLKDNDALFYEKFAGQWKMNTVNNTGAAQNWDVTVYTAEEGDPDYENFIYVSGMMGYDWTLATLKYNYDKATNKVTLTVVTGFSDVIPFAEDVNFGLGGLNDVYLVSMIGGKLTTAPITAEVSADFKTVTFNPEEGLVGAITDKSANYLGYVWFRAFNIEMVKK